jgi:hypothetical protein
VIYLRTNPAVEGRRSTMTAANGPMAMQPCISSLRCLRLRRLGCRSPAHERDWHCSSSITA